MRWNYTVPALSLLQIGQFMHLLTLNHNDARLKISEFCACVLNKEKEIVWTRTWVIESFHSIANTIVSYSLLSTRPWQSSSRCLVSAECPWRDWARSNLKAHISPMKEGQKVCTTPYSSIDVYHTSFPLKVVQSLANYANGYSLQKLFTKQNSNFLGLT